MRLGLLEPIDLKHRTQKLSFTLDELEEHIGRAIVHVRVQDRAFLEIYGALAIPD